MAKAFLQHIAEDLLQQDNEYSLTTTVILPTQRACATLKTYFIDLAATSIVLPRIMSISDFVASYSDNSLASELYAIGMLYKSYQYCVDDAEAFDKFFPWGKILLRDFDEVDKNLSPVKQIFSLVDAQKSIDDDFALPQEALEVLQQFFGSAFHSEDAVKQSFIKIWQVLYPLYISFTEAMHSEGYCTSGNMYRQLVENIAYNEYSFSASQFYFCGFNALTRAEERLIDLLSAQAEVHLYWDADNSYMDSDIHEAGLFLRQYRKMFTSAKHHWICSDFLQSKNIHIIAAGSLSLQHAFVSQHIASLPSDHKSAITLCEERALQNLMSFLPSRDFNITMGISFQDLPHYAFISRFMKLFLSKRSEAILAESWLEFIHHEGLLKVTGIDIQKLDGLNTFVISNNKPYLSSSFIEKFLECTGLFDGLGLSEKSIQDGIITLVTLIKANEKQLFDTQGVVGHLYTAIEQLFLDIQKVALVVDDITLVSLLDKHLKTLSIPLDTDTEADKQIMGILETRLLDFKTLYVLNVNEGIMPKSSRQYSFIPYNIKKAYNIPTHQDYDAIYAYHFYRLMHRAENVFLVYQTGDSGAEPSRYVLQVEHEYAAHNMIIHSQMYSKNAVVQQSQYLPILINKTPEMMAVLSNMKFSATALQLYCKCPVAFFYKYVAKIKEPEEVIEGTDDMLLGQLFHSAMEYIYRPMIGKPLRILSALTPQSLETLVSDALQKAYYAANLQWDILQLEGKNALDRDILKKLLVQVLQKDAHSDAAVTLYDVESKVEKNIRIADYTILLTGTLDRVDRIGEDYYRVIDYKTGKVSLAVSGKGKSMDDVFSVEGKYDLQGYMYAYLLGTLPIDICFYDLTHHAESVSLPPISRETMHQFEEKLIAVLKEILDINLPFVQQPKEEIAQKSPYAVLLS